MKSRQSLPADYSCSTQFVIFTYIAQYSDLSHCKWNEIPTSGQSRLKFGEFDVFFPSKTVSKFMMKSANHINTFLLHRTLTPIGHSLHHGGKWLIPRKDGKPDSWWLRSSVPWSRRSTLCCWSRLRWRCRRRWTGSWSRWMCGKKEWRGKPCVKLLSSISCIRGHVC